MLISKYANLGNLEKLDCETPHIYVKKIEFACNYFASVKNLPELRKKDVMAEMVIHCLPSKNPYIELKNRFRDMHMENGIPNYYKYGTPDGRWRYDLEIMTTIIELAEECFDDGKTVENINLTGLDHDTETQMDEDSDDDVVEIENPNPIIPEPTIEISSDTEIDPEVDNDEVNNVLQQNNEDMEYESDPEEDFDDFEDHEPSSPVCKGGWIVEQHFKLL